MFNNNVSFTLLACIQFVGLIVAMDSEQRDKMKEFFEKKETERRDALS